MNLDDLQWMPTQIYKDITLYKLGFQYKTKWGFFSGELTEDEDDSNLLSFSVQADCIDEGVIFTGNMWISEDDEIPSNAQQIISDYNKFLAELNSLTQQEKLNLVKKYHPNWFDFMTLSQV